MGGIGSGSWYRWDTKPTDGNFWRLPVQSLKKFADIKKGHWIKGSWQWSRNGEMLSWVSYEINTYSDSYWMRVFYNNKKSGKDYDYKINLETTKPHYGGLRWWFICPIQGCGRRVGVLYLSNIFTCRHCRNLSYSTQNETPPFRMLSRAQKIHKQLGGSGITGDWFPKPKGMHRKTYERKIQLIENLSQNSTAAMMGMFDKYAKQF